MLIKMTAGVTKVVQVTNIAPQATKDQMHILFGYLGKIEDIRLYPTIRDVSCPVQSRICYIKFVDSSTVGIAQHMTNTVFIDRALIVVPVSNGDIPDEYYALEMTRNGTIVPGLTPIDPKLPKHVKNHVYNNEVILTVDPNLKQNSLPPYPPLPSNFDSAKIEATRRTVLMLNYDQNEQTIDEIIDFFNQNNVGEIKYLRTCTERENTTRQHLLIEFSDQQSVVNALKLNDAEFKNKKIEIQHATQPIAIPQAKSNEAAQKEIEEAMTRFKEAQNMINASIEPVIGMLTKDKRSTSSRRSRSRSTGRRRRRTRSRSKERKRSRSSRRRRSRSSRRRRTRSRSNSAKRRSSKRKESEKQRSKSRERERDRDNRREKRRSRSRCRRRSNSAKRRRSRSRSKSRGKRERGEGGGGGGGSSRKSHKKDKDRDRERERRSEKRRSRSPPRVRNYDEEERGFDDEKKKKTDKDNKKNEEDDEEKRSREEEKSDNNMDISNSP